MSSIQEVQAAEKKVQAVLRELKKPDLTSRDDLHQQLVRATDEYVKAIAELKILSADANRTR
ncbi:MAG: hypothetical protein ACJ72H_05705 [Candidatus Sulfotelmatobacter sp.]|jgi:hypothetical protein